MKERVSAGLKNAVLSVTSGLRHLASVTAKRDLWEDGWAGRVGLDDQSSYRAPRRGGGGAVAVAAFGGSWVLMATCGQDYTVVLADNSAV